MNEIETPPFFYIFICILASMNVKNEIGMKIKNGANLVAQALCRNTLGRVPVIAICFMMLFASNANAFWLDIIKGLATVVKTVAEQKKGSSTAKAQTVSTNPAPNPTPVPKIVAEPTEQQLTAAFDSLSRYCKELSSQGFPCGMHSAKSTISFSNALEIANTRADGELAKSVEQFVETKAAFVMKQVEDEDGEITESQEYSSALKVAANQSLRGAQTYLTHSRTTKNAKGKDVYEVLVVRVLDANLFDRALTEKSQGNPVSLQIIAENSKGIVSKIKDYLKKKI